MKWMLIVAVFGSQPIKTDLLFDTLAACLSAAEAMRADMAVAYNTWDEWASELPSVRYVNGRDAARQYQSRRMLNSGTCIPHATK